MSGKRENNKIKSGTDENLVIQKKMRQIRERKNKRKKYCLWTSVMLVVCVIHLFFSLAVVEGNSMRPSLLPKDLLLVLRYPIDYKQNDTVIIKKGNVDKTYVKRIIGVPGDVIMITEEGKVTCNGKNVEISESYGETEPGDIFEFPIKLGAGEYFVLGDNRENSKDSRTFGVVKKSELKGRVCMIFRRE